MFGCPLKLLFWEKGWGAWRGAAVNARIPETKGLDERGCKAIARGAMLHCAAVIAAAHYF